ncbi:MAG: translation initiation factor IF-2 associated domain-containing protein, partial [Kiloniellaceae bacterium]
MTTSKEPEAKRPLKLNQPGKLQLKKTVETGQVRQSFSHGRSKAVTVEVKRSRTFERGTSGRMKEVTEAAAEAEAALSEAPAPAAPQPEVEEKPTTAKRLSAEERALREAEEAEERQRAAETAEHQPAAAAEDAATGAPAATPAAEPSKDRPRPAAKTAEPAAEEDDDGPARAKARKGPVVPAKPAPSRSRGEPRRRAGKLTINQALDGQEGRQRS